MKSTSTRDQRLKIPRELMFFFTTFPAQGGGSHVKKTGRGCSLEILNRTPKRYQDLDLYVWLETFFTRKR